eukprot:jgi/Ulvmu1/1211/UM109_0009.1
MSSFEGKDGICEEQGDASPAYDASEPAGAEAQLMEELSLTDAPVLASVHEGTPQDFVSADDLGGHQDVHLVESTVWEPSNDPVAHGHAEPNFLPPFANEENKGINRKIQNLEQNLEQAESELEETRDRKQIMDEHLKSVQSEIAYSQARVTAKRKEIQSETHLKALSERELARYDADIRVLKKERSEVLDKVNSLQNHIYKANEKVDQFKILMNWSQEELEQWTLTQQQKEEDSEAIERYQAQDRAKIKELDLTVERMNRTVAAKRTELEREVTDTQSAQMQLQKAADDFARLHKERQQLIQQWENAVAQMRRTDDAINAASELFAEKRGSLREKQRKLDISAQFLDDQLQTNKECENLISALERNLATLRTQYATEQAQFAEVSEQVEIMKTTLSKSGNDHASMVAKNAALQAELGAKRSRLDDIRRRVAANHRKLESEYSHLSTLAEKEKELELLGALEDKRIVEVEKSLRALEKLQFEKGQELFKERKREKDLISEISGGQAQSRNLVNKIQQLDDQVIRQQELLYNVEFQLQQMERRVSRAKGERSDEETGVLNERIKGLTTELEGVNLQHSMLLAQVKKAEDELQHANTAHAQQTREHGKVKGEMEAVELETEMLSRSMKKTTAERQSALVDLDVRRLEVQHLRESLNAQADTVFSLENRKYQLEQSLKERRHEISVHRQALEAEHKLAKEDVHRVTVELQERRARVDKLEAKFHVVSTKKHSLYEEEEPKSQAYYVIKAAQERQELQHRGDLLDADNHRLQDEVATLERTLEQMIESNTAFNRSYKPVNEKRAFAERVKLREQLDKVYDRLKFKRQEERGLLGDVAQAEARVAQLREEEADLRRVVEEVERRQAEAQAAVQVRDTLGRAVRPCRSCMRWRRLALPTAMSRLGSLG